MRRQLIIVIGALTAGLTFIGAAHGQQTPAANNPKPSLAGGQTGPAAGSSKSTAGQAPATEPAAPSPFKTEKEKDSYALGMNIGRGLKKEPVDLDLAAVLHGLSDSLNGGQPLLTDAEMDAALKALQSEAQKNHEAEVQKAAEANMKEGEEFLAANKTKDGVVALPSGLQYKVITAGSGPKPTATDKVVCNYSGKLINGTEFDSSYKRGQPATFPVNGVIKGWTEALQLMPVGSKWQLFIPSDLAYGARGAGGVIGPNATLVFEVELVSIQSQPAKPATPAVPATPAKP